MGREARIRDSEEARGEASVSLFTKPLGLSRLHQVACVITSVLGQCWRGRGEKPRAFVVLSGGVRSGIGDLLWPPQTCFP